MKKKPAITTLFLDIGKVLLTNGWSKEYRLLAANEFQYDFEEVEAKHRMIVDPFELGKFTLDEYLNLVVFDQKRLFTPLQFQEFMFGQSKPFPKMIQLIHELKEKYALKIAVVSNESRELNAYRIQKFKLDEIVDYFVSSCLVHYRKPDRDIYHLALDLAQVDPKEVVYIDDISFYVEMAESLGINSICHRDYESTCEKLASFGLYRT